MKDEISVTLHLSRVLQALEFASTFKNVNCNVVFNLFYTGYLMKEVKNADISLPEGDVNPIAPLPKHMLSIMVSYSHKTFDYLLNI